MRDGWGRDKVARDRMAETGAHSLTSSACARRVLEAPWRMPGANITDYFNYGLNERTWREFCAKVEQYRCVHEVIP